MAHFHTRHKAISRGKINTVGACAYRTGTHLVCQRMGQSFNYAHKAVQRVEILLPKDAPLWAQKLQKLVQDDRTSGVQHLSDLAEAAEKRIDSRVYREFEFALPSEFSPAQNYALANEVITDLCCSEGMLALQSFHLDEDPNTGQKKPHCHTLLLTRRLTEKGLSEHKERAWNHRTFHEKLFESVASYTNFSLKQYGFDQRIDHRSYRARGLEIEPQPKRGRAVQDKAHRGETTDKMQEFNAVKLGNMHRILRRPEMVFDIVTRSQSTFVWEDVQKVLVRYFDDAAAFSKIEARLQSSKDLICLKGARETEQEEKQELSKKVYTSKAMACQEIELVQTAQNLSQKKEHALYESITQAIIADHNLALQKKGFGGLSSDQTQAIEQMTREQNLVSVVGYAGAGKTTALEAVKEIYEAHGYNVLGLAPTGRATRNLADVGIRSQVLDKFLWLFDQGREQVKEKTLVVLDEAGMVDTRRFAHFLSSMEELGCKVVTMGDAEQLQAVQAGPAFRLVTEEVDPSRLESVIRQKEAWQREATQLFGQQETREALTLYQKKGAFTFVEEGRPQALCPASTVDTFLMARRIAGNIWFEMLADIGLTSGKALTSEDWENLKAHPDWQRHKDWSRQRDMSLGVIQRVFNPHATYLEQRNVHPKLLKMKEAPAYRFDETRPQNICDVRSQTKQALAQAWHAFREENPDKTSMILTYSNQDAKDLSDQIRHTLKEAGEIDKHEKRYTVVVEERDDFNKMLRRPRDRSFAVGDRLLFTKNNTGLGVSNGTLGTVTELTKQTIKVTLDEKKAEGTAKEVSFAPNLYPYFDHGWATTIHKAQGVTVDETFKLASFEETRNLAYVGMTRHRDDVQVFCSRHDFWREEKVLDRLSRSAEKLSSLDYVSSDQLLQQMQQDRLRDRALTKLRDVTAATTYVGGRLWREVCQHFNKETIPLENPTMPDLNRSWTEAERAKEILEQGSTVQKSRDFSMEM